MKIQYLTQMHKIKTLPLWKEAFFDDSEAFVDYYYKMKMKDNKVLALELKEEIVSMLNLNPFKIQLNNIKYFADYIVGVATKAEHRKKGYMRMILECAIKDMYNMKRPFTYLMPADEAIYTPFDFQFIYNQTNLLINHQRFEYNGANEEFVWEKATSGDVDSISDVANVVLKERYYIYTLRSSDYYINLTEELKTGGGYILLCRNQNKIIGFVSCDHENFDQVIYREPLFFKHYEKEFLLGIINYHKSNFSDIKLKITAIDKQECDIFEKLKVVSNNEYKALIMARILHLPSFVKEIKSRRPLTITIKVIDDIISENNATYIWEINQNSNIFTKLMEQSEMVYAAESSNNRYNEIPDVIIKIKDLTAWLFGYITIKELYIKDKIVCNIDIDNLSSVITYGKVFINEIV